MSFFKPSKPKVPKEAPPLGPVTVDETVVDQELLAREKRRKGFAASILTGEQGLAADVLAGTRAINGGRESATKKLMGG
jgi:hypothetical protein